MFGVEIAITKSLVKMQTFASLNLDENVYIAIEIHIASFYLSNCEVKCQPSVLITVQLRQILSCGLLPQPLSSWN